MYANSTTVAMDDETLVKPLTRRTNRSKYRKKKESKQIQSRTRGLPKRKNASKALWKEVETVAAELLSSSEMDGFVIQESAKPISTSEMDGFVIQESAKPIAASTPHATSCQSATTSTPYCQNATRARKRKFEGPRAEIPNNNKELNDTAKLKFPAKIHYVLNLQLDCIKKCGKDAFRVHGAKRFEAEVLPRFFNMSNLHSFEDELMQHGFTQIVHGPRKDAYQHKDFIIGNKERIDKIHLTTPDAISAPSLRTKLQFMTGRGDKEQDGGERQLQPLLSETLATEVELRVKVEVCMDGDAPFDCFICYTSVRKSRFLLSFFMLHFAMLTN
jgi:hypothetical protein